MVKTVEINNQTLSIKPNHSLPFTTVHNRKITVQLPIIAKLAAASGFPNGVFSIF